MFFIIATLRKEEGLRLQQRLETILLLVRKDHHVDSRNIKIHFNIEPWKLNKVDHTLEMIAKWKPRKVILYLDNEQQPIIHRWINGDISECISSRIPNELGIHPTILSKELLMKIDDRDIFGYF